MVAVGPLPCAYAQVRRCSCEIFDGYGRDIAAIDLMRRDLASVPLPIYACATRRSQATTPGHEDNAEAAFDRFP